MLDLIVVDLAFHDGDSQRVIKHHAESYAIESHKDCSQYLVASHDFLTNTEKTGLVHHTLKVNQLISDREPWQLHNRPNGNLLYRADRTSTIFHDLSCNMLLIRYLKALSKREKFLYVAFGRVAIVICCSELSGDGCITLAISYR